MDDKMLSGFFEGLTAGLKTVGELRKCYDETMAFDFNALNFLCPKENKISEILSYFLDPSQGHGQGKRFLEQFCAYLTGNFKTNGDREKWQILLEKPIRVQTEHFTDQSRRIDITITFGDCDFVIGIESKICGAGDQPDQLSDYNKYLSSKTNGEYILLYLTQDGAEPDPVSIGEKEKDALKKEGKLILASGNHDLINIIERFIAVCKAQRVRYFLEEFKTYLKKGDELMNTQNYIQNFITGSDNGHTNYDYIKVALNVYSTMQDARIIWAKLWDDVKKELREHFPKEYKMEFANSFDEMCTRNGKILTIHTGKYEIYAEFDVVLTDPYFYIFKKDLSPKQLEVLRKLNYISVDIENGWMYINMWDYSGSWLTNSKPWLDMIKEDGKRSPFAQAIISEVEKINNALSQV